MVLTVAVLAKNAAQLLPACLSSLQFADHLIVADDNSTDATVKVARSAHAQVITLPPNSDFAFKRNYLLSRISTPWTLFIDADEEVTPQLATEITTLLKSPHFAAYQLLRQDILWGHRMRYGDGSVWLTRLGQTKAGSWQGRVHEQWHISGDQGRLASPLIHHPHPSLVEFLQRINLYSDLRAQELHQEKVPSGLFPITLYPPLKFLHLYLIKQGFRDGMPGFVQSMTMAFYTFLVRGKLWLLNRSASA